MYYTFKEVVKQGTPKIRDGNIQCQDGAWAQTIDLSEFHEGEIELAVSLGSYSNPAIVIKKDTILPSFDLGTVADTVQEELVLHGECGEDGQVAFTIVEDAEVAITTACKGRVWSLRVDLSGRPDGDYQFTADFRDKDRQPCPPDGRADHQGYYAPGNHSDEQGSTSPDQLAP